MGQASHSLMVVDISRDKLVRPLNSLKVVLDV